MKEFDGHPEATVAIDYKHLKIGSTAFRQEGLIPAKYTCDGENISPPLDIGNIPEEAKCLVLVVIDPDALTSARVHWLIWNMPVTHHVKENEAHGIAGLNDFQNNRYDGPCPPSGTHRYFFKIYALKKLLNIPRNSKIDLLERMMSEHIIGFGELIGSYKRKN